MFTWLIPVLLSTGFLQGDRWVIERTVIDNPTGDVTTAKRHEKLSYSVVRAEAELTVISCESAPWESKAKPAKKLVSFKPNGSLLGMEDEPNERWGRVSRMEWTATEARQGIEWSRKWSASPNLLEAKVTVRPTSKTAKDTTLTVTYKEGILTKCTGVIKILNNVRIVEDAVFTIYESPAPAAMKPTSVTVTDRLKEIHLIGQDRTSP